MINNYSITNFKIHKTEYEFNLHGLSVITGTNNSGKSSLIQSLRLLSMISSKSTDYPRLPFESVNELGNLKNTLNKTVNRDSSIIYKFSLDVEELEFCNVELEFDSIFNYNFAFDAKEDMAILKRISFYFGTEDLTLDYEFYINDTNQSIVTYDLFQINNETKSRDLIQNEVIVQGLKISYVPQKITNESTLLMIVCQKLMKINTGTIIFAPALRNVNETALAEVLYRFKDNIIFDNKNTLQEAFDFWTHKLLNSEFRIKTENNNRKFVNVEKNIEFDLCQIGFGYSQVIPIILQILLAKKGDHVLIENPEVHLHPKWRTNLVELFYYAVNCGVNILIETQSMEIVNRIRLFIKRNKSLKEKTSLYFFKKNEFDCVIENIEIEETGNLDSWPDDFVDKVTIDDSFELM